MLCRRKFPMQQGCTAVPACCAAIAAAPFANGSLRFWILCYARLRLGIWCVIMKMQLAGIVPLLVLGSLRLEGSGT